MATIHPYPVEVQWQGGRDGSGTVRAENSGFSFPVAVPPEFQGPGGATNPEELLTSALAACYTITFGIVAANRKLPVQSVVTHAKGEVEQSGASFVYTKIHVMPTITLGPDASDEQMKMTEEMAHKADAYCIVTNAVRGKVEIVLDPKIQKE